MKSSVSEILNRFGKINIVIANAGFGVVGEVADLNLSDFKRQNETNVYGVLRTFYSTIDPLKSTHGSFVIMGSVLSYLSGPGRGPYALSKYAVRALHEALELEINKFGVQSILINPGFIKTELRRVDNEGHFHENADQNFSKLHMSAEKAAKIMLNGIYSRKREINVTFHGKILIFISKHFSFLIRLMYRLGIKGRNAVKVDN